ncbi:FecR family protein [Pedobacter hiemivivus]|uniref:DUF4974 domain-containing protein n=1 Tax=Pedobacter hiemivivus TaxID=2530454 RepID=A0A4R0N7F3_9SPHI|nr:FecR family protein [Pedobacter hiemivivus]TCC96029.1 DUF4974 domain-containing protein [Pedobacter hiemivivus]
MLENKREKELKEILKRYISHQASPTEVEAVDHWYDLLDVSEAKIQSLSQSKQPKIKSLYIWTSAACICLMTAFAAWFYVGPGVTPPLDMLISTAATERKEVTLTDGTVVMLNTGTELLVSGNFGKEERGVMLKGEAYFKVAKNPHKPFVIQSGQLSTRVLGTAFNISAYPDRERIKISVLTGVVRVSQVKGKSETILADQMSANQTISFFRKTGKFEMNSEDALLITSWKDNKLYIDNASIADIAEQLKGFYHLEVKDLSLASRKDRYTIRFNRESMKAVLEILTQLTKREFEYDNKQITIK